MYVCHKETYETVCVHLKLTHINEVHKIVDTWSHLLWALLACQMDVTFTMLLIMVDSKNISTNTLHM